MPPHTHRYLSIASVVFLSTVFLPEVSAAATNKNIKMECSQDEHVFSSAHGQFRLDICSPTAEAVTPAIETDSETPVLGELRFISGEATNKVTATWPFEVDMLSAWVGGEGLQFWNGHQACHSLVLGLDTASMVTKLAYTTIL